MCVFGQGKSGVGGVGAPAVPTSSMEATNTLAAGSRVAVELSSAVIRAMAVGPPFPCMQSLAPALFVADLGVRVVAG